MLMKQQIKKAYHTPQLLIVPMTRRKSLLMSSVDVENMTTVSGSWDEEVEE